MFILDSLVDLLIRPGESILEDNLPGLLPQLAPEMLEWSSRTICFQLPGAVNNL